MLCAVVGAVVYAIGIPAVMACTTALRSPLYREDSKLKCRRSVRREPADYATASMRSRYAFLYNGYSTDRSGIVVAWEALVMLRKLAVALAGSLLRDPYLQILIALLILVVSGFATAFVQPYEMGWLNVLDTFGLFVLIVTQILSIIYFYAETAEYPFMDPTALERIVTATLFALNTIAGLAFATAYVCDRVDLRATLCRRGYKVVRIVKMGPDAALDEVRRAQNDGDESFWWHHPSGVGVHRPPVELYRADGAQSGTWIWCDDDKADVVSRAVPQLLQVVDSVNALAVGEDYFWLRPATGQMLDSKAATKYPDVGGRRCCWDRSSDGEDAQEPQQCADAVATSAAIDAGAIGKLGRVSEVRNPAIEAFAARKSHSRVEADPMASATKSARLQTMGDGVPRRSRAASSQASWTARADLCGEDGGIAMREYRRPEPRYL